MNDKLERDLRRAINVGGLLGNDTELMNRCYDALFAQPPADCGLEVFTVPGRYLAVNRKNTGAQDVVLKSDADARDAMRLERIAGLESLIKRYAKRMCDAEAELAALKAQKPVAWVGVLEDNATLLVSEPQLWTAIPLYAAPVKQEDKPNEYP